MALSSRERPAADLRATATTAASHTVAHTDGQTTRSAATWNASAIRHWPPAGRTAMAGWRRRAGGLLPIKRSPDALHAIYLKRFRVVSEWSRPSCLVVVAAAVVVWLSHFRAFSRRQITSSLAWPRSGRPATWPDDWQPCDWPQDARLGAPDSSRWCRPIGWRRSRPAAQRLTIIPMTAAAKPTAVGLRVCVRAPPASRSPLAGRRMQIHRQITAIIHHCRAPPPPPGRQTAAELSSHRVLIKRHRCARLRAAAGELEQLSGRDDRSAVCLSGGRP
jgi:hypothetical protein